MMPGGKISGWLGGLPMKPSLALVLAIALAGCGVAAKSEARNEYQKSVADYRACLDANPNDLKACDDKRLAMEVEERASNNLAAGVSEHGNTTANINVQSR
jgi:hypothetical protein